MTGNPMYILGDISCDFTGQFLVQIYLNKVLLGETNNCIFTKNLTCKFLLENRNILTFPSSTRMLNLREDIDSVDFDVETEEGLYTFCLRKIQQKTRIDEVIT